MARLGRSRPIRPHIQPFNLTREVPQQIPGLALWLDATKITGLADGAAVAQWNDTSGQGRHATQATGTLQPTYQTLELNGLPVVRFDGTDDFLRAAAFGPLAQPTTTFVVIRLATTAGSRTIIDTAAAGNRQLLWVDGTNNRFEMYAGSVGVTGGTPNVSPHVLTVVWDGASSSMRVDGTQVITGNPGTGGLEGLTVAADIGNGGPGSADYGEFVTYNRALTTTERDQLEAYLTGKWIAATGTNAPAGEAAGTGQALDAVVAVGVSAEVASGTGQAPDAVAAVGGNAEAAAGTGQALDATAAAGASAGAAVGAGVAPDPTAAVGANADVASGTGQALDATVSTANATNAQAGEAAGTGAALDTTAAIGANAEAASGTGAAPDALASVAPAAEVATGTGTAPDPTAAVGANAGAAAGTGAALDATVSTAAQTSAQADVALGTGAALDPTVAIAVGAGIATGTGQAPDAVGQAGRDAPAGLASGTGSALDAAVAVVAAAEAALGAGVAYDAAVVFVTPVFAGTGTVTLAADGTGTVTTGDGDTGTVELAGTGTGTVTVG